MRCICGSFRKELVLEEQTNNPTVDLKEIGETEKNVKSTDDNVGNDDYDFKSQDFDALRDECLKNGILFEDTEFPADETSLQLSKQNIRQIKWLRPRDLVENPQFFVDGFSRFDVKQGELGDCWFLAAAAALTQNSEMFMRVVPHDQGYDENYAGIFHFRFWQFGKWIDVVVDDRLPTYEGELLYMRSSQDNEFWSVLLEKAYAKLHGSYEALRGGSTCEAMEVIY